MGHTETETAAWSQAEVSGLEVHGTLFGRSHEFEHDGRRVQVRLPSIVLDGIRPRPEDERKVRLASWRSVDPTPEDSRYQVSVVELTIGMTGVLPLPPAIFDQPPKHPEIAGPELSSELDALAVEYEGRLASCLSHWESVVRWISGSSALGVERSASTRESARRLNFTSLVRASDGRRFWTPSVGIMLHGASLMSESLWNRIGTVLEEGCQAPIWFRFLDEAYHRFNSWDAGGAVLSSAIACETLCREVFWMASGSTTAPAARDLIDRVSASAILQKWGKLTNISKTTSRVGEVGDLFTLRNRLMHAGGHGRAVDREEVRRLMSAARAFVHSGDDWRYGQLGQENPAKF